MEFTILHHSYRFKTTSNENKYGKWDYIVYNLIFTAHDQYFKGMCVDLAAEWKRVLVTKDKDKADEYLLKSIEEHSDAERNKIFFKAWEYQSPHLVYNEKFDVFQLRDYIQDNPATRGTIAYIEDLKRGITYGRFTPFSSLYSCVHNLQYWWD